MKDRYHAWGKILILLGLVSAFQSCYRYDPIRDKLNRKKESQQPTPPSQQKKEVTLQDIEAYYAFDKTLGLDVASQQIKKITDERTVNGKKIRISNAQILTSDKAQGLLVLKVEGRVDDQIFSNSYIVEGFKKEQSQQEEIVLERIEEYYSFDKTLGLDAAKQKIETTKEERLVGGRKICINEVKITFEDKEQGILTLEVKGTVDGKPFSGNYTIQGFQKKEPEPQPQITTYKMDFEVWEKEQKKDFFLPVASEPFPNSFWASGSNEGFYFILFKQPPYPVIPLENGYKGRGAQIQSRPGMVFWGKGSYLVAGSLFNGSVTTSKLTANPLEAVLFGTAIEQYPIELRGKFRYEPGPKYIDGTPSKNSKEGKEISGVIDQGVISVIFYEVNNAEDSLDGTNLYTSPKIVSVGKLVLDSTNKQWKDFSVKVLPTNQELFRTIDLKNKKYKMAMVFSSSIKGDQYLGAVGSTLDIDEVELIVTDMPHKASTN